MIFLSTNTVNIEMSVRAIKEAIVKFQNTIKSKVAVKKSTLSLLLPIVGDEE